MDYKVIKTQLVELPVIAATSARKFNFPTQNFLRLKQIVSIEILTVLDLSVSPQNNPVTTGAQMVMGMLTLYGDNPEAPNAQGEWIQQYPLTSLHRINNGTDPFVFEKTQFEPRNIVWEKSYIEIFQSLANDAAVSWLFNVGYMGNEGD